MAKSLLAAVHNAVAGTVEDALDESETGVALVKAPDLGKTSTTVFVAHKTGEHMAAQNQPAGGNPNPGISQAEHDAAVSAARAEGVTAGAKEATDRLSAALGAEGVKGDAGRMAAALDLAVKSPGMSGADVAAFVTANVAASKPGSTPAADYAASRSAAASLAAPQVKTGGKGDKSALAAAVSATNKRR